MACRLEASQKSPRQDGLKGEQLVTNVEPSRIDHDTLSYWEGLRERKLTLTRCGDCQQWIHPPKACCPICWSDNIGHEQPSGEATLFSYLVQPIAPGAAPSPGPMTVAADQLRNYLGITDVRATQGDHPLALIDSTLV